MWTPPWAQPNRLNGVMDNPAFRRWFGGSVIRNADGTPKIVYHGTGKSLQFTAFRDWRPAFFTDDIKYARLYTGKTGRGRVIKAYLRIERPFDSSSDEQARALFNDEFIPYANNRWTTLSASKKFRPLQKGERLPFIWADEFWTYLRRMDREGRPMYDGLIVDEGSIAPTPALVPLYSWQIKSVDNVGTFDPTNPDILNGW